MSKVIPKEDSHSYQRWEAPVVDHGMAASGAASGRGRGDNAGLLTAERIEEIEQQAHQEGFEAGRREGLEAGRAEIEARLQQVDALMGAIARPLEDVDQQVEQELVTLAMAVARQLVRRELKADPGQIVAVVREALGALPAATQNVVLHLHPEDATLLREVMQVSDGEQAWKIDEDPVLTRGGCRIVSDTSQIDASVENRLHSVIASVLGSERDRDRSA